jgi:hypothetical protein
MSDVVLHQAGLPAEYRPPEMSKPLRSLVTVLGRGFNTYDPGPVVRAEAAALARQLGVACAPAGDVRVLDWLKRLNAGLAYPLTAREFTVRAGVVAQALSAMPIAVFTIESADEAIRTFEYFPGGARLTGMLTPRAEDVRRLRRNLVTVVGSDAPAEVSHRPATQEGVDAVLASFRPRFAEAMAPVRAASDVVAPPRSRPAALSPPVLLESYRQAAARESNPARRALLQSRMGGGNDVA